MPTVRQETQAAIDSLQALFGRHEKLSTGQIALLVASPSRVVRMLGLDDTIRIHQEPLGEYDPLGNVVPDSSPIDVYIRVPGLLYPEAYLAILMHELSHVLLYKISIYYCLNETFAWLLPLVLFGSALRDLFNTARAQIKILNRAFGLGEDKLYAALFYLEEKEVELASIKNKLNAELLNIDMDNIRVSIFTLGEILSKFSNIPTTEDAKRILTLCEREFSRIECEATSIERRQIQVKSSIAQWTVNDWLSLAPYAHKTPEVAKQISIIKNLRNQRDRLALILSSATANICWEPFYRSVQLAQYIFRAT